MNNELVTKVKSTLMSAEFKKRFLQIVQDDVIFTKEVAFAMMALQGSDILQKCSDASIIQAVYNVATTGLSLNPTLKFAALTPRYIGGNYEAVLSPMYQGLVKLVVDSGSATNIKTHIVYEGDEFEILLGSEYRILHRPRFQTKNAQIVYSIATLGDGSHLIEYMTIEEIDKVRATSDSYKAYLAGRLKPEHCIWLNHESEMRRKTVLRRIIKYIPKTEKYSQIAEALELDNGDFVADISKTSYLETLISSSSFNPDDQSRFMRMITPDMSNGEADALISIMQKNQNTNLPDTLKAIQRSAANAGKNTDQNVSKKTNESGTV